MVIDRQRLNTNTDEHIGMPFGSINKIDSIIYFDDLEDLGRFNPEDMNASDLTPDQDHYLHGIKRTPLDISTDEIRRITGLIGECHDFHRVPSDKYRTFVRHIKHHIDLKQTDIEDILRNLHHEVFCKGCSTDADTWRKTFLKFEFYNTGYKYACGRKLSRYGYPLIIYLVIAEDLRTNKTAALVSFTSYDFEKLMLSYSSLLLNPYT